MHYNPTTTRYSDVTWSSRLFTSLPTWLFSNSLFRQTRREPHIPHHFSFVRRIHQWAVDSPKIFPVMCKSFPLAWNHHGMTPLQYTATLLNISLVCDRTSTERNKTIYKQFTENCAYMNLYCGTCHPRMWLICTLSGGLKSIFTNIVTL